MKRATLTSSPPSPIMPSAGLCRVQCGLACRVWDSRPHTRHNHSPFREETSLSTTIWRGADHERQGDAWCGWSGRWPGMQTDTGAADIHAELGGWPGAVDGACEFLQTRRAARVPGDTVIRAIHLSRLRFVRACRARVVWRHTP